MLLPQTRQNRHCQDLIEVCQQPKYRRANPMQSCKSALASSLAALPIRTAAVERLPPSPSGRSGQFPEWTQCKQWSTVCRSPIRKSASAVAEQTNSSSCLRYLLKRSVLAYCSRTRPIDQIILDTAC